VQITSSLEAAGVAFQCSQLKPLDMHDAHAVCCDGAWDNCGWVVPGIE
jgi:hypothetical protein